MNQEQKFDRIIKNKVDEAEFPFDENNWNKLSMQLDAERRITSNRGWGKFLFLGLLFLGITSASIALYKIQGPLDFKDGLQNLQSFTNNLSYTNENLNGKKNQQSSNLVSLNLAGNSFNNNSFSNGNHTNTINTAANEYSEITNKNVNLQSENFFKNNMTSGTNVEAQKKHPSANNSKDLERSTQSGSKDPSIKELMTTTKTKSYLNGVINLEHTDLNRIDSKLQIAFSNRNAKLSPLKVPLWYDEDYHRKGKKRISFLDVDAGGAFLLGWNSKNGKDARGFNWYAGVNYGKFLTKKFGVSVGSQFYNVGNIKQSFYQSSKSVYGLGSTSTNTVITTKSLFYFSVPVKAYYAINSNNQIGFGVSPSFLFSSKNEVENFRLTDNIKSNETKSNTSGIYEGVRLNNILISAFYKVKINKRMAINTEFLYGIRDIFKNTIINNYSQKPVGLRLGVQYTLFEK